MSQDELSMNKLRQLPNQSDVQSKVVNPPWKKPTRPCPFYSQGQCLFSDSCSFLHDVKIKVQRPAVKHIEEIQDEAHISGKLPLLTGLTIPSQSSSRSPNRSPRMTSLLLALKDVIGTEANPSEEERTEFIDDLRNSTLASGGESVKYDEGNVELVNCTNASVEGMKFHGQDTITLNSEAKEKEDLTAKDLDSDESLSFGDAYAPAFCEGGGHSLSREDSIDSGYGDGITTLSRTGEPSPFPHSSTLDLLPSPFGRPLSVQIFRPSSIHGALFSSQSSPLTSSASETATSPRKLYDRPIYFARRHSLASEASGDVRCHSVENNILSSYQKKESRSRSNSSLCSLDSLSSSPVDVQIPFSPPARTSTVRIAASPVIVDQQPAFQRSRAVSDLTVVARNDIGSAGSLVEQPSQLSEIEDEIPTSVYDSPSNVDARSPSAPSYNFSGTMSLYKSTSMSRSPNPETGGIMAQLKAESPLQTDSSGQSPVVSVLSSGPGCSSRRSGESSSSKVPFGSRHTKRHDMTKSFIRPSSLNLPQQWSASTSPQSSDSPSDQFSSGLRPLRLSTIPGPSFSTSALDYDPPPITPFLPPSPSVLSDYSISNNQLLSSARSSVIPEHVRNTLFTASPLSPLLLDGPDQSHQLSNLGSPISISAPQSPIIDPLQTLVKDYRHPPKHLQNNRNNRTPSMLSATIYSDDIYEGVNVEDPTADNYDNTIRNPIPQVSQVSLSSPTTSTMLSPVFSRDHDEHIRRSLSSSRATSRSDSSAPIPRASSRLSDRPPLHAIATPRPTLMFAIASDSVEAVERVLEDGEVGPNDQVGPQSALAFTLTNNQLLNKTDIVKALLGYGADPSTVKDLLLQSPRSVNNSPSSENEKDSSVSELKSKIDPVTRYFIARAVAPLTQRTSALIKRSSFRPLARLRYDVIGQDRAFEQLFRVLSMHSQNLSVAPVVVLLCGPSGHGKSLLARRFGSLLNVPTHTVNMTTLKDTHDLWQSYSMSPYEEPSVSTLAEFLTENEGKRCVVVLDEIDKIVDEKALWSLLMPWELGRCSFAAGQRHIDVRDVVWLGTSNIGNELVFEYQSQRPDPESPMDQQEYANLVAMFRPGVSRCLGPSLISRVTAILPFVSFTTEEKMAIATQALFSLGGQMARSMSPRAVESLASKALNGYLPPEGARSLYRAVSTQLLDALDSV